MHYDGTMMVDYEDKINKLETEVAAMREKVSFFTVIYGKFDSTLDKMEKQIEDRRQDTNEDLRDVYKKIEDVENSLMQEIKALREDMRRQHEVENKKIDELNRWRWIVMGGAAVIGWIVSKMFK